MTSVKVKIVGIAPLLVNRYVMEKSEKSKAKRRDEKIDPVAEAEKSLYKDEKIGCYAPSEWIEACLREAGKVYKGTRGKGTMKATILSSVFVEPEKIPLNKQTYDEVDIRPVVIQRQKVVKGRPKFNNWELEFTINFDKDRIDKETLREILEEAGATKAIGDYRPKFGRFKVVMFG